MKKILTALALSLAALTASATSLVVEYFYHAVANTPAGYTHNQYGYVGIVQPTKFGTFDAGLQGAGATTRGVGTDRQSGWEVGYSYALPVGKFNVIPRIATGAMNRIDPAGAGFTLNARYWLASVEGQLPLNDKLGVYTSYSHMNSINADSIARANRVQVGVDYAVTKSIGVRAGYSYQKFAEDNLNGVVLIGTYSF